MLDGVVVGTDEGLDVVGSNVGLDVLGCIVGLTVGLLVGISVSGHVSQRT